MPGHTRQGVYIGHQPVAQFVVVHHAFVGRVAVGGDVKDFAEGVLAVAPEEGTEGSELVPAGVEFAPLLQVGRSFGSPGIAVLHTEAPDVHGPIGDSGEGKVKAGRYLGFHVFPAGADVAAPGGRRVTLQPREPGTGEQKDPAVGIGFPLAIINGLGIHQGIGVEIFGGRPQSGGGHQRLAVFHAGIGEDVGF